MGSQEPIPQQGAEGATAHQGVHQGVGGGVRGGGLSRAHPARPPANGRPEHGPRRYPRARGDEADGPQDAFGFSEIQHRQRRRSGERGTDARRCRRRGHPGDSLTCALPQRPLHLTTWPMLLDRRVCRRIALCAKARSSNACQTRLPERSSGSTAPSASTPGKFASRTPIMGIPHLSANRSANHPGRTRADRGGSRRLNY